MTSLSARLIRLLLSAYTYPLRRRHASLSRSVQLKDGGFRPPRGFTFRSERFGGVETPRHRQISRYKSAVCHAGYEGALDSLHA